MALNNHKAIRPKTKPAALAGREHKLTDKQRAFACEYIRVRDATKAALAAGVSERSAASMGCQWLDRDRFPLVAAEVDRLLAQVEERSVMSAVEVRRYVHTVMQVSLPDYFLPGEGGGWLISLDDFRRLPPHVKQLVEACEMHSTETTTKDGRQVVQSVLRVRLVSKTTAMVLAAKYGLTERHSVESKVEVDLAAVLGSIPKGPVEDEVEQRIDEALWQPATERPANRLDCRLSGTGEGRHE